MDADESLRRKLLRHSIGPKALVLQRRLNETQRIVKEIPDGIDHGAILELVAVGDQRSL